MYGQRGGGLRSLLIGGQNFGAEAAALPVPEAERSDVVGANILQVVELQLQLAYSHVLGGQLLLQPPQLILLPEEHSQELREEGHNRYTLICRYEKLKQEVRW